MAFLGRLPGSGLQNFAFSRRELLKKLSAIGAVSLLSKPQPKSLEPQSKSSYPLPEFKIGDLVASDWMPDEEDWDAPSSATDFGEILGMRYVLEPESAWVAPNTWLYYVVWTHSTCNGTNYPCYDGEPTRGCDLRLISLAEERCKR
jgi:hypothetical protein